MKVLCQQKYKEINDMFTKMSKDSEYKSGWDVWIKRDFGYALRLHNDKSIKFQVISYHGYKDVTKYFKNVRDAVKHIKSMAKVCKNVDLIVTNSNGQYLFDAEFECNKGFVREWGGNSRVMSQYLSYVVNNCK